MNLQEGHPIHHLYALGVVDVLAQFCQWANKEANLGQLKTDLKRAKDNNDAAEVADLERIKAELEALPQ